MKSPLHKLLFLKPKANVNATDIADKLLALKNVQEVILTEGDVGYIVKTRFFSEKSDKEAEKYITKSIGSKLGAAVVCSSFRK